MKICNCKKVCPFLKDKAIHEEAFSDGDIFKEGAAFFNLSYIGYDNLLSVRLYVNGCFQAICLQKMMETGKGLSIMEKMHRNGNGLNLIRHHFNFEEDGKSCPIYAERLMIELNDKEIKDA